MKPYYEDDYCTIYHGDCRDVLPQIEADVVVTDPPYGVGLDYDGIEDTRDALERLIADVWPHLERFSRVAITPGIDNLTRWPQATWVLAWTWEHTGSTGRWGFSQWGPIVVYGTDPFLSAGLGRRPDVVRCGVGGVIAHGHPCPKPLSAWTRIIQRVSLDGEVIADPFMGSGTTLRAAKDLGRKAIGVEQSERYCEIAAKRLAQEVLDFGGAA